MRKLVGAIAAGALVPTSGVIFAELLLFTTKHYNTVPKPALGFDVFDITTGCMFSILALAMTVRSKHVSNHLLLLFLAMLALFAVFRLIFPAHLDFHQGIVEILFNIVAFVALCYALAVMELDPTQ